MNKFFLILLLIFSAVILKATNLENSIVKIFVTKQGYNFSEPWKRSAIKRSTATGFIIEGNRIITNAHAVSNYKYVQVRFDSNPTKINVEVEFIADDYDLAILRFKDDFDTSNLQPLQLGNMPNIQDKVRACGFPVGGDNLSITEGIVSRIQIYKYVFSQQNFTVLQTDAAINPGNSGGPVMKDNLVVGVAFQGNKRADNIGYMIPVHIVKHFLLDVKDGQYDGIPSLGMKWIPLESKVHRRMLGLENDESGILIKEVFNNSTLKNVLKKGDVLLKINDKNIDINGSVIFRGKERIGFNYLLENSNYGEKMKFSILRDNKRFDETVALNIPKKEAGVAKYSSIDAPTYYVKSGFIFEKLSVNYLNKYTKSMFNRKDTPYQLISLLEKPLPDVEEIIFLVSVLSDDANEGYQKLENIVVEKVNGVKVKNFSEFIKLTNTEDFIVIEDLEGLTIVIDGKLAKERDSVIQEKYNIKSMYSEDLGQYFE